MGFVNDERIVVPQARSDANSDNNMPSVITLIRVSPLSRSSKRTRYPTRLPSPHQALLQCGWRRYGRRYGAAEYDQSSLIDPYRLQDKF
ncbi:MAG: hypothetical protein CM1200mP41_24190 [Gammaproteobacteria bacterium]|nr:MAG: hypothetical protein CM1200mP41_24190 [Gammaproteobacteria bacterium]